MARKGTSHLTCWTKKFGGEEEIGEKEKQKEERRKREKKERRRRRREKLHLFSRFLGDPTVGVRQSKRQSRSPQQELRLGTEIEEFQQTPRCRGFSYLVLLLA